MGGKVRVGKQIAPLIVDVIKKTSASVYWEPFLGGANTFTSVSQYVETAIGSDVMPDIVMMWQAVQRGWLPPDSITREEYARLRAAEPSALRGFVGFGCSFGGKWFGGYGAQTVDRKHPTGHVSYGSASTVRAQADAMKRAHVTLMDYRDARPRPGWVVYCDPPYAGTTAYSGVGGWDAAEFWVTAEKWARDGVHVLVSEYSAPEGWRVVWEGDTPSSLGAADNASRVVERLYVPDYARRQLVNA